MNESVLSLYTGNENDILEETSLIVKVSLQKIAILVVGDMRNDNGSSAPTQIIQILSSALIMFQSVEDQDGSGSKTFHVSLKDCAISTTENFKMVSRSLSSPIIGPVGMEFRSVNTTENSGVVVKREVSVSCGALSATLLGQDVLFIVKLLRQYQSELKQFDSNTGLNKRSMLSPSKEKGSSIATTLKFQLQPYSLKLMRSRVDAKSETCPFFEVNGEAYGKLEGCSYSLHGESRAETYMCYFNEDTSEWEKIFEPITIVFDFEQQPNDFVSVFP